MANINIKKFVNSIQVLRSLTSVLNPKVRLDLCAYVLMSVFTDVKNGWPVMRRIINIHLNAERATGFL